jgi:hypothetical protein
MTTDPVGTFLAVCGAFQNLTEQGKDNHGQIVEWFLKFVGLDPGNPWCAAYVSYCGFHALKDPVTLKSSWPLTLTGGCAVLGEAAKKLGVLMDEPEAGDLFLLYYPKLGRFAHTGAVRSVTGTLAGLTMEGNTSGGGSREGWGCFARERQFAARDRFIRWKNLL